MQSGRNTCGDGRVVIPDARVIGMISCDKYKIQNGRVEDVKQSCGNAKRSCGNAKESCENVTRSCENAEQPLLNKPRELTFISVVIVNQLTAWVASSNQHDREQCHEVTSPFCVVEGNVVGDGVAVGGLCFGRRFGLLAIVFQWEGQLQVRDDGSPVDCFGSATKPIVITTQNGLDLRGECETVVWKLNTVVI